MNKMHLAPILFILVLPMAPIEASDATEKSNNTFVFIDADDCKDADQQSLGMKALLERNLSVQVLSVCPNASLIMDRILHLVHDQRLLDESNEAAQLILANSVDVMHTLHHILPSLSLKLFSIKLDLNPLKNALLLARKLNWSKSFLVLISREGMIDEFELELIVDESRVCVEQVVQSSLRKAMDPDFALEVSSSKSSKTIVVDLTSDVDCAIDTKTDIMARLMGKATNTDHEFMVYQGVNNVSKWVDLLKPKLNDAAMGRTLVLARPSSSICQHEMVKPILNLINEEDPRSEFLTVSLVDTNLSLINLGRIVDNNLSLNTTIMDTLMLNKDVNDIYSCMTFYRSGTSDAWPRYNDLSKTVLMTLVGAHVLICCVLLLSEICCCICLKPDYSLLVLVLLVLLLDVGALLVHVDQHVHIVELHQSVKILLTPSLLATLLTFLNVLTLVNLLTEEATASSCMLLWPVLSALHIEMLYSMHAEDNLDPMCSNKPLWQTWPWLHCWLLLLFQLALSPVAALKDLKLALQALATWVMGLVVIAVLLLLHHGQVDHVVQRLQPDVGVLAIVVLVSFVVVHVLVLPQLCCGPSKAATPPLTPLSPSVHSEWSQQEAREDTPDTLQMAEIDHNANKRNQFQPTLHFSHDF